MSVKVTVKDEYGDFMTSVELPSRPFKGDWIQLREGEDERLIRQVTFTPDGSGDFTIETE